MIADSVFGKSEEFLGFKDPWFGLSGLPEESDHSQESEKNHKFVLFSATLCMSCPVMRKCEKKVFP